MLFYEMSQVGLKLGNPNLFAFVTRTTCLLAQLCQGLELEAFKIYFLSR